MAAGRILRRLSTCARKPPAHRREKMFGLGRPRALDRNAKARIAHLANCLMRRTEPGRHYGSFDGMHLADRKAKVKKQLPVGLGVSEIARRFRSL